ncbi:hypothetical protein HKD37_05G013071 [Glycine soja]
MSEIEELQEQMKANMETMKEQMTTMMEAMMDMRKIMEVNVVVAVATSTATKGDPTHLPIFNQESHLVTNVEGQGGATVVVAYGPQYTQSHNRYTFSPYAREALVDHTVTGFRPHPGYITEGHAFSGVLVLSAPRASKYRLWRDLEAQVVPPMMEREMITMIMDTLQVFYYKKMVGYMPSSFVDLVFAGERIKASLRKGKFICIASVNPGNGGLGRSGERKNEGEPHVVAAVSTWLNFPLALYNPINITTQPMSVPVDYPPPYQPKTPSQPQRPPLNQPQHPPTAHPRPNTTPNTNQNTNQGRNFQKKKPVEFTPIPMSYADLLLYLLNNAMVAMSLTKIPQPPFSRGYNSNVTCAYHGGVLGHSIEHCMTLKHKVQSLIDAGKLRFEENNHLTSRSSIFMCLALITMQGQGAAQSFDGCLLDLETKPLGREKFLLKELCRFDFLIASGDT